MICGFCQASILESRCDRNWGFHHRNPIDLEISAVEGCVFCSRLADRLQEAKRSLPHSWYRRVEPGEAAYRWSIRKAASTSELGECVIITFRSLPSRLERELKGSESKEEVYTADLTFYLLPEAALSFPPSPHELGCSTSSAQSWKQVNKWLDECEGGHTNCKRHGSGKSFRPTRLLDIGPSGSPWPPTAVRMNCTDIQGSQADSVETYVTLSHSWGPEPQFARLLKGNLKQWAEKGIPWTEVCSNKNFVHAIEVARRIKARYIWIDSLCIVQDNASDWHAEAPKMHAIYLNSHCNIAASDSADAHGGMFRARSSHRVAAAQYTGVPGQSSVLLGDTTWRVVAGSLWQDDLIGGPLYTRGWVFQERMLAPRLLHYSKDQIFWDCATASACESLPAGLPLELDTTARVDRRWRGWLRAPVEEASMDVDAFWASAVRTYTSNNLTKQKDKLLAIWGIAALVAEKQKRQWGGWGAGLWAAELEEQLAWTVTPSHEIQPMDGEQMRNPEFPTWSWASVVGTVELAPPWGLEAIYTVSGPGGQQKPIFFQELPEESSEDAKAFGIESRGIQMQCHVGNGSVRYYADPARVLLELADDSEDMNGIQVLPDATLQDGSSVEFLILLASRDRKRDRTEDGGFVMTAIVEDNVDIEYTYSGFGLLIQNGERAGVYNRMGVIKFSELSQNHWDRVRRVCGDNGDSKTTRLDPTSPSARQIILE